MICISNIHLKPGYTDEDLTEKVCNILGCKDASSTMYRIVSKSLDARRGYEMSCIISVDAEIKGDSEKSAARRAKRSGADIIYPVTEKKYGQPPVKRQYGKRPVVVGFGPAGIFIALLLARNGFAPIIIERGGDIDERVKKVDIFYKTGVLDESTNIQFGEGGAGAFSDGKLTTLIKDTNLRCRFVLETFVRYGAPEEILYESHPHIGTDKLRCVIKNIRNDIISLGGEFRFGCRFIGYETDGNNIYAALFEASSGMYKTDADTIFLAIGHSARDTFET
ncbi:MAG: FAD-dependent oxidoreductase, partial [Eubacteriales bacterium]|nr:FAD-dependent oxidoreductase [Eubacteriales bacterium]